MNSTSTNTIAALPPYASVGSLPYGSPSSSGPDPVPPDDDVGPALLITSSVLLACALVTSALRLYVRTHNRMLGWDDYTILLTVLCAVARFGCQVAQVRHGDGRHRIYLTPDDYQLSNMYGWYAQLFLFVGLCLLKVSICLLLLRIKNDDRRLRRLMYAVITGLVLTNGGVLLILLAECRPIEAYWMGDGDVLGSRRCGCTASISPLVSFKSGRVPVM